ncbi:MAG: SigE family RNA polymerase sigma factor [Acidimicrobiia bacterium]
MSPAPFRTGPPGPPTPTVDVDATVEVDLVAEEAREAAPDTTAMALSFDEAFENLHARAYRVAYRLVGRRAEAEDIAQEALARALTRWKKVSNHAEPWVVRVASNLAIDWWRTSRRLTGLDDETSGLPAGGTISTSLDSERVDLVRALRTLSRRQREVVTLRYIADLSERDVALQLRCSAGTVKTHASRGLAALRATLAESDGPDPTSAGSDTESARIEA